MTIRQAIKFLITANKWRRGAEIEMIDPKEFGEAIDDAVNSVKVVNTKKLNFETGKWENVPLIDQTSIFKLKK